MVQGIVWLTIGLADDVDTVKVIEVAFGIGKRAAEYVAGVPEGKGYPVEERVY